LSEHPTPADLEAFAEGRLELSRVGLVVAHLLSGCPGCRRLLLPCFTAGEGEEADSSPQDDLAVYDEPVRKAEEAVLLHGTRARNETKKVRKLLARLTTEPGVSFSVRRYGRYTVYEALLARSWQLRHDNPEEMVRSAWGARWIASRMESEFAPEQVMDLQARAEGEYGNALRVADRLDDAETHLGVAFQLAALGTGSPTLELRLQDLKASLLGTRHRYAEAVEVLDCLHAAQLSLGDRHGAGRALITKGLYVGYSGDAERALTLLEEGSAMLDSNRDPELVRLALHNRLEFTVRAERFEAALGLLETHLGVLEKGGRLDRCKLLRIEGLISTGLGTLEVAERSFRAAKKGFLELRVYGHAALMSLDLATVLLRQGKTPEARKSATEALQVFTHLRLTDTQLEALLVLRNALGAELLSVGLLQSLTDFLRRAEHDPTARYEPRF
jgi:tetratricopeptide (TPR) repeat protein